MSNMCIFIILVNCIELTSEVSRASVLKLAMWGNFVVIENKKMKLWAIVPYILEQNEVTGLYNAVSRLVLKVNKH